jgi:transcription-repair coupling factor (superfamily II helicase)
MALAGIRDLSVIQTPPEERQPIKTYVTAREGSLVREVVTRELARGGQVFFVHNRVQSIDREAQWLRALVPEARVAVAHGQMHEDLLASVMRSFVEGEVDVLACTTIIESGLDIPNANTIVIDDAQRLGLAQLYQLRGRVGRAGQRAYAYLLYPPERTLTERADKRLDVIGELQDLGAGFKLAMRDLEIRGAGNLLGEEQHGEIAAVGLEMYNRLLEQAVRSLQGRPMAELPAQVTVSLPQAAFLPPGYIGEEQLRLRCYQDMAACVTEPELERRSRGLADRFGPMPPEADRCGHPAPLRPWARPGGGGTPVPGVRRDLADPRLLPTPARAIARRGMGGCAPARAAGAGPADPGPPARAGLTIYTNEGSDVTSNIPLDLLPTLVLVGIMAMFVWLMLRRRERW